MRPHYRDPMNITGPTPGLVPRVLLGVVLLAMVARGDQILLRNGNTLEGKILGEGKALVRLELPFGTVDISRRDIREIRRTDPLDNLLFQGERLLYHQKFEEALEQFETAVRTAPQSRRACQRLTAARLRYADFLNGVYRYSDAVRLLRRVLAEDPTNEQARRHIEVITATMAAFEAQFGNAKSAIARNDLELAGKELRELWNRHPEKRKLVGRPLAYVAVKLGDRAAGAGSFTTASGYYERALTYHPDWFPQIVKRYTYAEARVAQHLLEQQHYREAEVILVQALRFAPESEALHYLAGKTLEAQGRTQEAIKHFDRIAPDPATPFDPQQAMARHRERARAESLASVTTKQPRRSNSLATVTSRGFRVHCAEKELGRRVADILPVHFDALAPRFKVKKFGRPCDVFIYPTKEQFQEATDANAWTPACATWDYRLGHLQSLQIATFQDCPQLLASVLPHELTHLLLAARLDYRRTIPLWANEGLATYSEPAFKHRYLARVLELAAWQRNLFPVADLLAITTYPEEERIELFYAQSHSLVRYLIKRTSYKRFLTFLDHLQNPDDWSIWKRSMRIRSASHLENLWKAQEIRRHQK